MVRRGRVFGAAFVLLSSASAVVACAGVAELGVSYEGADASAAASATGAADGGVDRSTVSDTADGAVDRQKVRESSVEPIDAHLPTPDFSNLHPCDEDGGLGQGSGCDTSAGMGCCINALGSTCMEQGAALAACVTTGTKNLFVACREASGEDACCWRGPPNGPRRAAYAVDCDGGSVACLDDAQCPNGQTCHTTSCGSPALSIGECGRDPQCP